LSFPLGFEFPFLGDLFLLLFSEFLDFSDCLPAVLFLLVVVGVEVKSLVEVPFEGGERVEMYSLWVYWRGEEGRGREGGKREGRGRREVEGEKEGRRKRGKRDKEDKEGYGG
jgi:hypothetical protein